MVTIIPFSCITCHSIQNWLQQKSVMTLDMLRFCVGELLEYKDVQRKMLCVAHSSSYSRARKKLDQAVADTANKD